MMGPKPTDGIVKEGYRRKGMRSPTVVSFISINCEIRHVFEINLPKSCQDSLIVPDDS